MSELKSDPATTEPNEGLNLPPRVAEGGERAMLEQAKTLCQQINAAAIAEWRQAVDPRKMDLELQMYHSSMAAHALRDFLNIL